MHTYRYIKSISSKYLVSGPAPIGRILNYIKRIKQGSYQTSIRGPRILHHKNLDDWTICFMVGLGLIKEPKRTANLNIQLTDIGEQIYNLIKNLPNFPDNLGKSKQDMLTIKEKLGNNYPGIYKVLKGIFLKSPVLKNLQVFFWKKNTNKIERKKFYEDYGKEFGILKAGFNRLPSLIQIAQFCDILVEDGTKIILHKMIKMNIGREIRKQKLGDYENEFLSDLSSEVLPRKRKAIVKVYIRNAKITKILKNLYNGKCQICNFTFKKKKDKNYSETHHIIPLGDNGSEEIKNVIIVCANCHKQLHYADVKLKGFGNNTRKIEISGISKDIKYKPKHFKAIKESDVK